MKVSIHTQKEKSKMDPHIFISQTQIVRILPRVLHLSFRERWGSCSILKQI